MIVITVGFWVVAAPVVNAQEDPPPPLPEGGAKEPEADDQEPKSKALERYQACFQKMIDKGSADNDFMKKCLGIAGARKNKSGERTSLSGADVNGVVKKKLPEIRDCYQALLTETKSLGVTPEGAIEAKLVVKHDGSVESSGFEPTSLTDVKLLACAKTKMAAWIFPKIAEGSPRTIVALSIRLVAKDGRVADARVATGFPRVSAAPSGLTTEQIVAVFRKNSGSVRRCYLELDKRRPGTAGKAKVDVGVDKDGKVGKVEFREISISDDKFKGCLVRELKAWRFPAVKDGIYETVSFPTFLFGAK